MGFLFLTTLLIAIGGASSGDASSAPTFSYLGGIFGVLFVATNSYVLPRIGAVKTVLLVISGQMIAGVMIDYQGGVSGGALAQFFGAAIIIVGMYLAGSPGPSCGEKYRERE